MRIVYTVLGAEPSPTDDRHIPLHVWVGQWNGELMGILTDPLKSLSIDLISLPADQSLKDEVIRLHHIGSIQRSLIHEDLPHITGLSVKEVQQVEHELVDAEYSDGTMNVDGVSVPTDMLTYRGLDFALGRDVSEYPFVVFRSAGRSVPWPNLGTRPADPW